MLTVLDVGAHDGYIGAWLNARYKGELIIDGLELHHGFAEVARGRGYRRVVCADAHHADQHFEPGSYDAVYAFEVLEHVPDMDAFLAALERMVKPDGRIYLSTPDGTYGAGSNPHHLRALRSIDVLDLLRRRGHVHDLVVGPDEVTFAAYTPAPRLADVAIFCGPGLDTWQPSDIATRGLGGSETAAIRLAEQLAEIGWVVTVYGQVSEGAYKDVIYRDWRTFDPLEPRQAVIASRMPEIFDRPVAAKHRLLWVHDVDCGDRLTPARADSIDHVLVLSDWQRQHVAGRYPFLGEKLVQTRNGIQGSYFTGPPMQRHHRAVYTSSPDRGLDVLLELWPRILEKAPDAELAWAYSPVYFKAAEQDPTVAAHAARIRELSQQPGVTALGSLSQPELAKLMRSSLVWVAPSWCTPADGPFHETSCIGAMEAQAAGCLVVASGWGALEETVKVGRLISGPGGSERWKTALVREITDGLTNRKTQLWAQAEGPKHAKTLGWHDVGVQIAGLIRT